MEPFAISSRKDGLAKHIASLSDKKVREESRSFLCEGFTLLREAAERKIFPEMVFLRESDAKRRAELELLLSDSPSSRLYLTADFVFEKMTREKGSDGILSLFSEGCLAKDKPFPDRAKLICLENIQDPGNVGTILRSAAALGFDGVWLAGCTDALGSRAVRASMGAVFRIPMKCFPDTEKMLSALKEERFFTVAACLSPDAGDIREGDYDRKCAFLIGNEGHGLTEEAIAFSNEKRIIPITEMESLNAAVAAAVFMWEIRRKAL